MRLACIVLLLVTPCAYAQGVLGTTNESRTHGPHSVSPVLTETTAETEWGYENQDHDGSSHDPYTGTNGQTWDEVWWYVNNRYDANPGQVSMNHGFIVIKPNYITGVIGACQLLNPADENPRKQELMYKAKDFKQIQGSIAGDGSSHWEVTYSSRLYLKAGGFEDSWTWGQVGAYAYGRLEIAVDGVWEYDHAGVMRSNDPAEFVDDHVASMSLFDHGTFTDGTAIGPLTDGKYSEIHANEREYDYQGGGINCERDVYLRDYAELSGSKFIHGPTLSVEYNSYGWLLAVNKGTSSSTCALAEVQHEKLWYTYRARTHVYTKTFDSQGTLINEETEPMYSYSLFTESELETEVTFDANGNAVVKYFVQEKYAEYKNDGFWAVEVTAYDDHDPQNPNQKIHTYKLK